MAPSNLFSTLEYWGFFSGPLFAILETQQGTVPSNAIPNPTQAKEDS